MIETFKPVDEESLSAIIDIIGKSWSINLEGYSQCSMRRRLHSFLELEDISSLSEFMHRVDTDDTFRSKLIGGLTVKYTEFFRDPEVFTNVTNLLAEMAGKEIIRIWHAGCSSGEELYSLAILMHERGLLNKCHFYGTDLNPESIRHASEGKFCPEEIESAVASYMRCNGKYDFRAYFSIGSTCAQIQPFLKKQLKFFNHNLVADSCFAKFDLVMCRNVLIYFDDEYQYRAMDVLSESLFTNGILAIGSSESIPPAYSDAYTVLDQQKKIFLRN